MFSTMFYHINTNKIIPEGVSFEIETPDGIQQYPLNWLNLSSPEDKVQHGILEIIEEEKPHYNEITQYLVENPLTQVDNKMVKSWTVQDLPVEIAEYNATQASNRFQEDVVKRVPSG